MEKQSTVLIVEDEPASLNLLASYFKAENYQVYKARSSEQAEKLISEKVIDVILMDIKIPGRSGLELTREFRSRSGVGIILVSQKDDDIDKIVGLELGADDYVTKPYNSRELMVRVRNLLDRIKYRSSASNNNFGDVKTGRTNNYGNTTPTRSNTNPNIRSNGSGYTKTRPTTKPNIRNNGNGYNGTISIITIITISV